MDTLIKNMDFSVKHWAPYPRRFPSAFPVVTAAFIEKDHWMRQTFLDCAFSLILRGRGEFHRNGKLWNVESPCVITQWPGEYLEYGPVDGTWDEVYIIYEPELMPKLQRCHLIDMERPVWPIHDLPSVNAQISELELWTKSPTPEEVVDRVDRTCERLVLETWLRPPSRAAVEPALMTLLQNVKTRLDQRIDLEAEAARNGMSVATFRRRWAAISDVSPARYLQQLRMRDACRRLVETNQPIAEIAHALGFEDEFYFSRRFRKEFQMPPREYRKAYQIRRHMGPAFL